MKKTSFFLRLLALAPLVLSGFSVRANFYNWTNTAGGNWYTAANWNPNGIPGVNDFAIFNTAGTYTVTLSGITAVNTLTMTAASGTQTLQASGGASLTILQSATIGSTANIQLPQGALMYQGALNFVNNGTISVVSAVITGNTINSGTLQIGSGSLEIFNCSGLGQLFNSSTGTIEFTGTNGSISQCVTGATLVNDGLIENGPGAGSNTISVPLQNTGQVVAQNSTLVIAGGSSAGSSGTFTSSPGAVLEFTTNFSHGSGTVVQGSSNIVTGGTFSVAGSSSLANLYFFHGAAFVPSGAVTVSNVYMEGGNLGGSNGVLSGTLTWNNGTVSNTPTIATNGTVIITGTPLSSLEDYGILTNAGTIEVQQGELIVLGTACFGSGELVNLATGLIDLQNDVSIENCLPDDALLLNEGTIQKSGGTNSSTIAVMLDNQGTVATKTGTMNISGSDTGDSAGVFFTAAGATNYFNANYTVSAATQFTGSGTNLVNVQTGSFEVEPGAALANMGLIGGNATFNGTFNVSNVTLAGATALMNGIAEFSGNLVWTGGTLTGAILKVGTSGVLTVATGSTVTYLCTLDNFGVINLAGDGSLSPSCNGALVNEASGVINFQGDNSRLLAGCPNLPPVINYGTIEKTAGSGIDFVDLPMGNDGTVIVDSGTLDFEGEFFPGDSTPSSTGVFVTGAGATLQLNSSFNFANPSPFIGPGTNTLNGGPDGFAGPMVISNVTLSAFAINLTNTVIFSNATLLGATLTGSDITIQGKLVAQAGTFGGSGLTIGSGAEVDVTGPLNVEGPLTNFGTINLEGGGNLFIIGQGCSQLGAVLNQAGGVIEMQDDSSIGNCASSGAITNSGLLEKLSGPGSAQISAQLQNFGMIDVLGGTLALAGGGEAFPGSEFDTAAGGTLDFTNGFMFDEAGAFSSTGTNELSAGLYTFTGPAAVSNLVLGGGTVTLSNTVTFSNVTLAGADLAGKGAVIAGKLIWTSGTFDINSALTIASNGDLVVEGTTNGNLTLDGVLTNAGLIEIVSGNLELNGTNCGGAPATLINSPGGAIELEGDVSIDNCGSNTYILNQGVLEKTAGTRILPARLAEGSTVSVSVTNIGTIGAATGTIQFTSPVTLSGGTLNITISGSNNYSDILLPPGTTLGGTLSATLLNGYVPATGSTFPLLLANTSGQFTNLSLPVLPSTSLWQITYAPPILTVVPAVTYSTEITGQVQLTNGTGVAGINVFAVSTSNGPVFNATTGNNGNYALSVSNGTYEVGLGNLLLEGYGSVSNQIVTVNNSNETANFTLGSYQGALFTAAATASPSVAGAVTGAGSYLPGAPAQFIATPNPGPLPYVFVNWTENGNILGSSETLNLTVNSNLNLSANFVYPTPEISVEPISQTVVTNGLLTLTIQASSLAPPLYYQWQFDGTNLTNGPEITGAQTSTLSVGGFATGESGSYTVIVTNAYGSITSAVATISAGLAPVITVQPTNVIQLSFENASFNAGATGTAPLAYQWLMNGSAVTGATNTALTLTDLGSNQAGSYSVVVTNLYGSATSHVATLTVLTNPALAVMKVIVGQGGKVAPDYDGKKLVISNKYNMTAVPSNGWLFGGWFGTVTTNTAKVSFAMRDNTVLEATFVTNFFLAAAGEYNGLFEPADVPRDQTNSGSINFNLTDTGSLSGKLNIGGQAATLSGKFDVTGAAKVVVQPKGFGNITNTLQLDPEDNAVTGQVTDGAFVADLTGYQAVFNSKFKATNFAGTYTMAIPGTTNPAVGPYGTGYGTVTVDTSGKITFSGSLADGTGASQTSAVSRDGYWPFYVSLYGGKGSLWSWNLFTNGEIVAAPVASWINGGNAAKSALYKQGFTNQAATITGQTYSSTNQPLLALTNAEVILLGGAAGAGLTNEITLTTANKITATNAADTNKLTLVINKNNGLVSGTFADPMNPKRTIKVNGVLLQNTTNAAGYFSGASQSGLFLLDAP